MCRSHRLFSDLIRLKDLAYRLLKSSTVACRPITLNYCGVIPLLFWIHTRYHSFQRNASFNFVVCHINLKFKKKQEARKNWVLLVGEKFMTGILIFPWKILWFSSESACTDHLCLWGTYGRLQGNFISHKIPVDIRWRKLFVEENCNY